MGRSILHEVANYFNLSHHSKGGVKHRQTLIYPKTMFLKKQHQERNRLLKYRDSIREKHFKKGDFTSIPNENPKTFTEQCFRELWEEKFCKTQQKSCLTSNMLDIS